jgi:hypothetical protein
MCRPHLIVQSFNYGLDFGPKNCAECGWDGSKKLCRMWMGWVLCIDGLLCLVESSMNLNIACPSFFHYG